jgi:protein-tyrosine phosphatase
VIDLHAHVLPGIDDGPPTLQGAVALAAKVADGGVRVLAATPHLRDDHPEVRPEELEDRVEDLQRALRRARVDLQIVPGGEVDIFWAQQATPETLRLVSYCRRGTDLLVETPYAPLSDRFEDLIFQLRARGMRVTLAHPERNASLRDKPKRLTALVHDGVLVQVTASALASPKRGSGTFARRLVSEGLAHVIASDSHGADIMRADLGDALAALDELAPRRAAWMVTEAPAAILAGEPLPPAPRDRARRRSWLGRLGLDRG